VTGVDARALTGVPSVFPRRVGRTSRPSGRWLALAVVEPTIYLSMSVHIIDMTGEDTSSTVDLGASEAEVLVGWGP
jgi:hypothetical protein